MHIIQDENGNPVPHGHDGEDGHSHEHGHTHEHAHDHEHSGAPADPGQEEASAQDKQKALLDYMVQHNDHHAAELDDVAEKFRADGQEDVAEQIKKAVDEFQKGNMYLKLAQSMVKEK